MNELKFSGNRCISLKDDIMMILFNEKNDPKDILNDIRNICMTQLSGGKEIGLGGFSTVSKLKLKISGVKNNHAGKKSFTKLHVIKATPHEKKRA